MQYVIPFVLVLHTLIAAGLVAVILLQRSEGGALGIGQNTSGLVSARGAADLLTRSTSALAGLFVLTSLGLAILYGQANKTRRIDPNAVAVPTAPGPLAPASPIAPAPPAAGVPIFPSAPGAVPGAGQAPPSFGLGEPAPTPSAPAAAPAAGPSAPAAPPAR